MGTIESTEKLGQRVVIAKGKLEKDVENATHRLKWLQQHSPQTLATMIKSVSDSFETCSPFLESTLLIAWMVDAQQVKEIVLNACRKVLRAPIDEAEYRWFTQYVFMSSVWMMKVADSDDKFMYEELLAIGNAVSQDIVSNMDAIYEHLQTHKQWHKVTAIHNETLVSRQDDADKVGLLQESGLKSVNEVKADGDGDQDMASFIDTSMAINMLTSTASRINDEFQRHIRLVMSSHGTFKAAPMKKVERSISKVENDYKDEQFPRAAKLLDLVRCSVTFNTVEQLCSGYVALINHAKSKHGIIELARVKNGFLDPNDGGYRDIKVNVIYKSQNPEHPDVKMVCEVQLLLINYLEEKKKIHKLYSILREQAFFKMVVSDNTQQKQKEVKDLRLTEVLNVGKEVSLPGYKHEHNERIYKCSLDTDTGLLGMEGHDWFGVVDMKTKKPIWNLDRETNFGGQIGSFGQQTHQWVTINGQKYVSLQTARNKIQMFKVVQSKDNGYQFVEDNKYELVYSSNKGADATINFCDFDHDFQHIFLVTDSFVEDKKYELVYSSNKGADATINFCDFDHDFQHIFLVTDFCVLEKRAVQDINAVILRIDLQERVSDSTLRNFRLSADGKYCAIGGGEDKPYFYVIDIANEEHMKLDSSVLTSTYVPCFINGENQFVAVADKRGFVEVWDIEKRKAVKSFQVESKEMIFSSASAQGVLAIAGQDKTVRLYDVSTWTCFYTQKFNCHGGSLHLTDDLRYVTVAGYDENKTDRCVVLKVQ
eukprot:CAMPEP_0202726786 /NCGR_PEP_ID=MMETSP1385-20130828/184789_1 /ASSEMBLY_ACC=CAM_ASM_000861 /TAXON_ID=933848 /ORGANISM="Elphidium margaritaceum" /LENGTH=764 /DNA_ID=CAMNT_0049393013 /DNA_START=111 /DNA_END=2406 /DNA_ORIENTATION=-